MTLVEYPVGDGAAALTRPGRYANNVINLGGVRFAVERPTWHLGLGTAWTGAAWAPGRAGAPHGPAPPDGTAPRTGHRAPRTARRASDTERGPKPPASGLAQRDRSDQAAAGTPSREAMLEAAAGRTAVITAATAPTPTTAAPTHRAGTRPLTKLSALP